MRRAPDEPGSRRANRGPSNTVEEIRSVLLRRQQSIRRARRVALRNARREDDPFFRQNLISEAETMYRASLARLPNEHDDL